jgi:4-amino-4-deoxy-L-arabinose transferase-like glycosyltransferase
VPSSTQQSEGAAASKGSFRSLTSFTSSTSFTSFLFGFFLGLAALAKGPAAIILSGGAVLLWAVFTKRWRDAFRCLHPVAIASFLLTALPWYILCARRNPDFFRAFIIEHNFNRFLTPQFQHIQPFWFYVPILLITFGRINFFCCAQTLARTQALSRNNTLLLLVPLLPILLFTL